jgi:type IV pilus assembly protein PilC
MKRYPKVFDTLTTSLIWVWEKTWQLGRILVELDTSLIESIEIRWKVRWAMIYPIFLLIMMIGVIIFLMAFVVPKITDWFLQADIDLPRLTQVVVDISNFVRNDWEFLLAWIIWIYALFKVFGSTYIWKMTYANIIIEVPIFGYIVRQSNIVYFIRSFTLLLDSWVLLLESLKTSSDVVTNLAYRKELVRVKNEVELWLTISKSLWLNTDYSDSIYLNHLFPEDFAYVVNTWEETWSLSVALKRIWDNYNWELKRYIWNLSTMVEPIIIVIVWALVWTIVIAIMLPFFKIGQVVQNL